MRLSGNIRLSFIAFVTTLACHRDLARPGKGNILFHDQLTVTLTEHDFCTSAAHCFRIDQSSTEGAAKNCLIDECVRVPDSWWPWLTTLNIPSDFYVPFFALRLHRLLKKYDAIWWYPTRSLSTTLSIPVTGPKVYCACPGIESSIINRNMHISNRWRHILFTRNYRKKYILVTMSVSVFRIWAFPYPK